MSRPLAVLVDDDPQQLAEASSAIEEAGFDLITFGAVGDALSFVDRREEFVDLFVLDRKLPMRAGEPAVDELGDELFRLVSSAYPDARILVFSGYTDFDHAQESMEGSGLLFEHGNTRIGRVSVLRKSQFDKFERHLNELRGVIAEFERIELTAPAAKDAREKRVLRRIAHHYEGSAIAAEPLAGGLTGAGVWRCAITTPRGAVAIVVAKLGQNIPSPGGLQDLVPRERIARRVEVISGLMGGTVVSVLQLAGESPTPLMSLLSIQDLRAATMVDSLRVTLDRLETSPTVTVPLREIVEQIIDWEVLSSELSKIGVDPPRPDLWTSTSTVMSHTDLHAGNVLICDGEPVIIDSDENVFSSALRDPVVLLLSAWVHPDSPLLGGDWPSVEDLTTRFGEATFSLNSPSPAWCASVLRWIADRSSSRRELWAIVMAYSVRQMRFRNVRDDSALQDRVNALATLAAHKLREE